MDKGHVFMTFSVCNLVFRHALPTFSLATVVALLHARLHPQDSWAFCEWKCRQSIKHTGKKCYRSNKKCVLHGQQKLKALSLGVVMCAGQEVTLLSEELLNTRIACSTLSSLPYYVLLVNHSHNWWSKFCSQVCSTRIWFMYCHTVEVQ